MFLKWLQSCAPLSREENWVLLTVFTPYHSGMLFVCECTVFLIILMDFFINDDLSSYSLHITGYQEGEFATVGCFTWDNKYFATIIH